MAVPHGHRRDPHRRGGRGRNLSATEWIKFGKTSVVGAATGVIAGLATVTPASGFIGPVGALILGVAAARSASSPQNWSSSDGRSTTPLTSLPCMASAACWVHCWSPASPLGPLGGNGLAENMTIAKQFGVQVVGLLATAAWSALATFAIVKITAALTGGLRVDEEDECWASILLPMAKRVMTSDRAWRTLSR